jgi:hypothetical protein
MNGEAAQPWKYFKGPFEFREPKSDSDGPWIYDGEGHQVVMLFWPTHSAEETPDAEQETYRIGRLLADAMNRGAAEPVASPVPNSSASALDGIAAECEITFSPNDADCEKQCVAYVRALKAEIAAKDSAIQIWKKLAVPPVLSVPQPPAQQVRFMQIRAAIQHINEGKNIHANVAFALTVLCEAIEASDAAQGGAHGTSNDSRLNVPVQEAKTVRELHRIESGAAMFGMLGRDSGKDVEKVEGKRKVSNRTLVELNHDYCLRDAELEAWAKQMQAFMRSGDKDELPDGVRWKHSRHHSEPDPMEAVKP